jgi:hypothetical protein
MVDVPRRRRYQLRPDGDRLRYPIGDGILNEGFIAARRHVKTGRPGNRLIVDPQSFERRTAEPLSIGDPTMNRTSAQLASSPERFEAVAYFLMDVVTSVISFWQTISSASAPRTSIRLTKLRADGLIALPTSSDLDVIDRDTLAELAEGSEFRSCGRGTILVPQARACSARRPFRTIHAAPRRR